MKKFIFNVLFIPSCVLIFCVDLLSLLLIYTLALIQLIPTLLSRFEWWSVNPDPLYFVNDPRKKSIWRQCVIEFKDTVNRNLYG